MLAAFERHEKSRSFLRAEVDPDRTKVSCARLLRCVGEDVGAPSDLESFESRRGDRRLELCFQQSAGDSPGPELDSLLGFLADRFVDENIGEL